MTNSNKLNLFVSQLTARNLNNPLITRPEEQKQREFLAFTGGHLLHMHLPAGVVAPHVQRTVDL
jgi:hypothetical protein